MKTTHTPGPWIACKGDAGQHINIECKRAGNDCQPIATLKGPDKEANARLIASAPELLEALEGLLDQIENGMPFTGSKKDMERASVEQARAAIAKATGNEVGK